MKPPRSLAALAPKATQRMLYSGLITNEQHAARDRQTHRSVQPRKRQPSHSAHLGRPHLMPLEVARFHLGLRGCRGQGIAEPGGVGACDGGQGIDALRCERSGHGLDLQESPAERIENGSQGRLELVDHLPSTHEHRIGRDDTADPIGNPLEIHIEPGHGHRVGADPPRHRRPGGIASEQPQESPLSLGHPNTARPRQQRIARSRPSRHSDRLDRADRRLK